MRAGTWLVFEGILPCADCRGIKTRLELFVDQNNPEPPFILKQEYIGANEGERTSVRSGMYGISVNTFRDAETAVFVLNPYERNNRMYFLHVSFDTIKLLNQQMGEIPSTMNHLLIRTETIREKQ
jgi:copper homeostasis protein (lipoprotein)